METQPPLPERTRSTINDPDSEVALGGADAVNDTPGIARHGATPGSPFNVVAPREKSAGRNTLVWLAIIVALGILAAYAAGMLR
ncbi:MAG TPA: hypothetical protein VGO75_06105 [Gemmatimonadaceae bacterium]|nr:hypothetical protein [Gemmatimonadaceae bacterium]